MNKHVRRIMIVALALALLLFAAGGAWKAATASPPMLARTLLQAPRAASYGLASLLPLSGNIGCGAGFAAPSHDAPDAVLAGARSFGGASVDEAESIVPTSDGGYILAGGTDSFGAGESDAWVLKLDRVGKIQWQKTYDGTSFDWAQSIANTKDGGYIVAGYTESFGVENRDAWVFKLDAAGNILWQKTYGGTQGSAASSLAPTLDGGYIVAGSTSSFGAGKQDAWVFELDGASNVLWQKTYGGTGEDSAQSIAATKDGGYILTGVTDWTLADEKLN